MANLSSGNSGTITAANTSQAVCAASTTQTYWCVHNPNASADLYLGIGEPASEAPGSIRIPPGKSYDSSAIPELTQAALSLYCGLAGAAFTILNVA